MPATVTDISAQYIDRQAKIGGGGFVKGQAFADDGTHMIYGDTGLSCYIRDPNNPARLSYENLFHRAKCTVPADADYDVVNGGGFGASICATNSSVAYFGQYNSLWKTSDRGLTIQRLTAFTPSDGLGNYTDGAKWTENVIACDPVQPNVVYVGTVNTQAGAGRIRFSNDGGATFTLIPTTSIPVPTATPWSVSHIVFDRSSGTTVVSGQTRTSRIVIQSQGVGCYQSIDGGQTWASIGGPAYCKCMAFAVDGVLYANNNIDNTISASSLSYYQIWKYASGTWTNISPLNGAPDPIRGTEFLSIACDPLNAARVTGWHSNATMVQSLNRGSTWSAQTSAINVVIGTDGATWIKNIFPSISLGSAKFHPTIANTVITTTGHTVLRSVVATSTGASLDYTQEYSGELENLVSMDVRHYGEGHPVIFCQMDQDFMPKYPHEMGEYPVRSALGPLQGATDPYGIGIPGINHGTSMAGSLLNPREVYAVIGGFDTVDQLSHDGGRTWNWPVSRCYYTSGIVAFGQAAVNHHNPLNIVRTPTGAAGSLPRYTTDGGATWATSVFSPVPPSTPGPPPTGINAGTMHPAYYAGKQATVADPNNAGHFYCSVYGDGVNPATENAGLYKSTDGGANFTRVFSGNITTANGDYWNLRLRMVPGHPGHIWATAAGQTPRRSTNYGVTWTDLPFVRAAIDIGFGKAAPGASYPTIFIAAMIASAGTLDSDYKPAVYRSIDETVSWQRITPISNTTPFLDIMTPDLMSYFWALDGDKGIFGRMYYAVGGAAGFHYLKMTSEPAPTTRVRLT
jgi:hypothetical protein